MSWFSSSIFGAGVPDIDVLDCWREAMDTKANHHTGQVRPRLKRAVRLAWEGHLTSVEYMDIRDMNIKNIPRGHMEKLASIVTRRVWMTQADQLGGILARVKCPVLCLRDMELSEAETRGPGHCHEEPGREVGAVGCDSGY